jgi:outer membrane protein insertion porin family
MYFAKSRALVPLFFALFSPLASASAASSVVDDSGVAHAYGAIVDSIIVSGNRHTKAFVILREMETQVGEVLDKKTIHRDIRYITDLSPFASVVVSAVWVAPGHSVLHVQVQERSGIFLRSILPFLKYDFESGLTYGLRWKDRNFRGRLEELNLTWLRNERQDNDLSLSWGAPWVGWKHISLGARISYFKRGDTPAELATVEQSSVAASVGVPLTDSRIYFSQLIGSLALSKSRSDSRNESSQIETTVSPQLGYRFDGRDSRLRPEGGQTGFLNVGASFPIDVSRGTSYFARVRARSFHKLGEKSVLALLSDTVYQFGDFPEWSVVRLGGSGTLRGHADSRYSGFHRWFGSVEWRYLYLPKRVVRVPIVKQIDVGLGFVTFLDTGIVWEDETNFDFDNVHGTGGVGLRFYSPLRDVFRLDFGFNYRGDARFHFGTGARF